MRADRLISIIMLLQSNRKMTARRLADELEVTERTIYRDLSALSFSGVPVFTERGPGGGIALVDEYQTTLTGLSAGETRALFMTGIPSPLDQLGVGADLRGAILKLKASLPESRQLEKDRVRQRILLDSNWWFQSDEEVPCLLAVQQALWQDRKLKITYPSYQEAAIEQEVSPLGLVAKASIWYLVYGYRGTWRVRRVSRIEKADVLEEKFLRPVDFDLAAFWKDWCQGIEQRGPYLVRLRASKNAVEILNKGLKEIIRQKPALISSADRQGMVTIEVGFDSFLTARTQLLGLGGAVEVLAPEPLRKSLIDFAEQVVAKYREKNDY